MDCSNITCLQVTLGEGESVRERDESKTQVTVNNKAVSVHAPGAVGDVLSSQQPTCANAQQVLHQAKHSLRLISAR